MGHINRQFPSLAQMSLSVAQGFDASVLPDIQDDPLGGNEGKRCQIPHVIAWDGIVYSATASESEMVFGNSDSGLGRWRINSRATFPDLPEQCLK